ncbi:MAG: Sec-independent protein translocase protein TatB [Hyphomicrobium sp.]
MFEISWSELLILAVVTLLFVGPKDLPIFLRTIGRYAGAARRQAAEFRSHFDQAMREAELDAMKEEMAKMQASVNAEVMNAKTAFDDAGRASTIVPPAQSTTTPPFSPQSLFTAGGAAASSAASNAASAVADGSAAVAASSAAADTDVASAPADAGPHAADKLQPPLPAVPSHPAKAEG